MVEWPGLILDAPFLLGLAPASGWWHLLPKQRNAHSVFPALNAASDPRAASFNGNGRLRSRATVTRPITSPPSPPRSVFSKSRKKNTLFLRRCFPPRLLAGPYPTLLHRRPPPSLTLVQASISPCRNRDLFSTLRPSCKSRGPCTRSSLCSSSIVTPPRLEFLPSYIGFFLRIRRRRFPDVPCLLNGFRAFLSMQPLSGNNACRA